MENKSTKSKTKKKHEHHELQKLGEALLTISEEKLISFDLDEELFDAIKLGKKISSHGALRRQKATHREIDETSGSRADSN